MRGGDWDLRIASIKQMAATFTAFDHPNYTKLMCCNNVSQGAFVVNITGRAWHSVGIDESREMLINKSCKTAIVSLSYYKSQAPMLQ